MTPLASTLEHADQQEGHQDQQNSSQTERADEQVHTMSRTQLHPP